MSVLMNELTQGLNVRAEDLNMRDRIHLVLLEWALGNRPDLDESTIEQATDEMLEAIEAVDDHV